MLRDPKTDGPNKRFEEGAFNYEYFEQVLLREAAMYADKWFLFVEEVAGFTGQGTRAEQFWRASETGGRAIEVIFENLNLSKPDPESFLGTTAESYLEKAQKQLSKHDDRSEDVRSLQDAARRNPYDSERLQRLARTVELSSQLRTVSSIGEGSAIPKEVLDALLKTGGGEDVSSIEEARREYTRSLQGAKNSDEWEIRERQKITIEYDNARLAQEKNPDATTRKAELARLERERDAARERVRKEGERLVGLEKQIRAADTSKTTSSARSSTGTVRLSDGSYLEDINNPEVMLLKLMFRPGRAVSDSELKAWDALYYGGTFFANVKNRGAANDPKSIRERLMLAKEIDKMMRGATENGVGWRKAPQNIGMLFVTAQFRAALNMAYERVRKVCRKEWVPLVDLMTHDQTHTYFAKLVAYEIAEAGYTFPGRNMTVQMSKTMSENQQRLLAVFTKLERGPDGYLYFSNAHSAFDDAERRQSEAHRRRYLEQNGRYFSDTYTDDVPSSSKRDRGWSTPGKLGKKPIYGTYSEEKAERERAALYGIL